MMATQYFPLNTKQLAKVQNADWWEKVLGRIKKPEDVTEFLFGVLEHPTDGTAMLVVDEAGYAALYPKLTPAQQAAADSKLLQENNPLIVAMKAAILATGPALP